MNLAQRQALRAKVHAATNPGYNTVISSDSSEPYAKMDTAALILARDYPVAPKPGTPERKTYDRLVAASTEFRERNKKEIEAAEAQREWTESEEYRDALEALNVARRFIEAPDVLAKLELSLETASLATFYSTLGAAADERRAKHSQELEQLKQQQEDLKLKTIEAEMENANLEVMQQMAQQARGINEQV